MNHRYKGIIFYIFFCIANICLLGSIFLEKTFIKKAPETITAHFYHEVLNKKETLFDPYDLKYVVQYSLLQNLAVGLIRESIENPNGFDPLLVDYWFQESDTMWKFKLKENLKWSNGAPIKASEIIESFNRLIASSARQLVYLRDVKTIHYEPASNMLSFEFNKKTPRDVLQEFSHPHAVILHPSNHNLNWEITSGPYFVKQYDVVNEKLLLSLNTHCNIRRYNQSRDVLLLGGIKDKSEMINFFDSVDMDVFFISPPVFHPVYQKMKRDKQNIRLHKGVPTVTRTFQYNLDHPFAKNKKAREEIAWIIDSFYKHAEMLDSEMAYTNQLIPFGYTGRLKDYERKQVPINEILGNTNYIN